MSQTISSFEITYSLSSSESSGLVNVQSKIYKNYSTSPSMHSFHFKQGDLIFGEASVDKANFYVSLLNEGVEIVDASRILSRLVTLTEDLTSFPSYSILTNVTLYLTLHILEIPSRMTEEQAIQESIDIAQAVQRPASEDSIYSLKKEMFIGNENEESKVDTTCMICLESYIKYQSLLCIPCGHKFCEKCLISWLQINGQCPLCRFCVP